MRTPNWQLNPPVPVAVHDDCTVFHWDRINEHLADIDEDPIEPDDGGVTVEFLSGDVVWAWNDSTNHELVMLTGGEGMERFRFDDPHMDEKFIEAARAVAYK